jgi:microcystin-dependent protein
MAIQVSGTEVISDARALTNITSIDATTAASISAEIAGIPTGVIAIWSGSVASIPSGWLICDGANSTPDLRDRFVIGAGSTYAVDATGGATTTASVAAHTHTLSGNTSNSGTHTHTGSTSNTGNHSHNVGSYGDGENLPYKPQRVPAGNTAASGNTATSNTGAHSHTFTTDAGGDHTHTLSGNAASTGDASVSILNPYYALCYIMKT